MFPEEAQLANLALEWPIRDLGKLAPRISVGFTPSIPHRGGNSVVDDSDERLVTLFLHTAPPRPKIG